jgi:UDP-glucuronate 4-epimerase
MLAVVTGCAGFIGSALVQRLAAASARVIGVDCLTSYYAEAQKRAALDRIRPLAGVEVIENDLLTLDLERLLADADVVFHLAAEPGVRGSWGSRFRVYVERNVLLTQRLLEAAIRSGVGRFVYASSSSVYGNATAYPTSETDLPRPHSPYGVTKLAAEHLVNLYARNHGLNTASLRYFTVYGPGQRPDMAFHSLIESMLDGRQFVVYGSGRQRRDFTYVSDAVEATFLAGTVEDVPPGTVLNVGGGDEASLLEAIDIIASLLRRRPLLDHVDPTPGDVDRTGARTDGARSLLGWNPAVSLEAGLAAQVQWHQTVWRESRSTEHAGTGQPAPGDDGSGCRVSA